MMNKMGWTLGQILSLCQFSKECIANGDDLNQEVAEIGIDSRKIEPGDIFIAICGERFDGHDFLTEAFDHGALAAMVNRTWLEKNIARYPTQNFLAVEDTLKGLQKVAKAYRKYTNPEILALTGTNGKTTTKEMIANVLSGQYKIHKTRGNFNNHIGVPLTLLQMRKPVEIAIIEMGTNHFGEIAALCEIAEPDAALITNIGRGHTEFLQDIDGVRKAKQELFEFVAPKGIAFVNLDDPNVVKAARKAGTKQQKRYGFSQAASIRGENLRLQKDGHATFYWRDFEVKVGVPGLHNASNALAAIAVGVHYQVPGPQTTAALAQPLEIFGRMRKLMIAGRTVIDDVYNANPESMQAALLFLHKMHADRAKIAVLGDMFELGEAAEKAHQDILNLALSFELDWILVTGALMEKASRTLKEAPEGLLWFEHRAALGEKLARLSQPGDAILVKGSRGMKMEEVIAVLKEQLLDDEF